MKKEGRLSPLCTQEQLLLYACMQTTIYLPSKYFRLYTVFVRGTFFLGRLSTPSNVDAHHVRRNCKLDSGVAPHSVPHDNLPFHACNRTEIFLGISQRQRSRVAARSCLSPRKTSRSNQLMKQIDDATLLKKRGKVRL